MRDGEAAGFGVRLGARIIDGLLLAAVLLLVALVTTSGVPTAWSGVVGAVYEVVFVWQRGATVGKSFLGLRVVPVDADGPIPLSTSLLRWAVLGVWPLLGDTGIVGFLSFVVTVAVVAMVIARPDRRGPHDFAAGTQVVRV